MQCDQRLLQLKEREVGPARMRKYKSEISSLRRICGGDLDATLADMEKTEGLVGKIRRLPYQPETRADFFLVLRMLWKLANGYDLEDRPKEIRWLKVKTARKDLKLPTGMVTDAEVQAMLKQCSVRYKAIVMLLYESGMRISELCALKKSDVEFVKGGVRLHIPAETKTGARNVLVLDSEPYLAAWLAAHPRREANAPLFAGKMKGDVNHPMIRKAIRVAARNAGIQRRIYPHLFRHTAATRLGAFLTEAQMNAYLGWVPGSGMSGRYIHMSGRDVDPGILAMHNRPVEAEKNIDVLEPKICDRCGKTNMHDVKMCGYCGLPFDKEKAKKQELEVQEQIKRMKEAQAASYKEMLELKEKIRPLLKGKT